MSRTIPLLMVDAFTTTPGKGNRAGVVLDATGLSRDEMQAVAKLANVSETAFMIPTPDCADYELEVRYFTPSIEVPSCGHATVASHFARCESLGVEEGRFVAKIGVGILPVDAVMADGKRKIVMTQGGIEFFPPLAREACSEMLAALGLESGDLNDSLPIQEVSTGHSKIMIPIKSVGKLDSLVPDMGRLAAAGKEIGCNGFFVFAFNEDGDDCLTSGRMFAPGIGIDEDPVTGNGNGPCGAYLSKHGILPADEMLVYRGRQGVAMGKEGAVEVTVHRDSHGPAVIQVAGLAVVAERKVAEISLDPSGKPVARFVA